MRHAPRTALPAALLFVVAANAQDLSGPVRLTTEFRGTAMCLDVVNGGPRNNQVGLQPCGNLSGQHWSTRPH